MNRRDAEAFGKVSKRNSKIPGGTYSLDATRCNVGGRLRGKEGSVCSRCYALRIQKFRSTVHNAWAKNHDVTVAAIDKDADAWCQAIAWQILKSGDSYFRWFDSGDLQSIKMLQAIVDVARMTPRVRHWLPTREVGIVLRWRGSLPNNLVIRVSSPMTDQRPIKGLPRGVKTSTVHKDSKPVGFICEARSRGNKCGPCRACWQRDVKNVSYPLH